MFVFHLFHKSLQTIFCKQFFGKNQLKFGVEHTESGRLIAILDTLAESAQHDLFCHSRHSAHCLNHLYTTKLKPPGAVRLRPRGHDFELPTLKFEFNKRNFIVRSLFQYV